MRAPRPALVAAALLALVAVARAESPTQPPPPAAGFGAVPKTVTVERGSIANPFDASKKVFWFRPVAAPDSKPLPVVAFFHGFGARGPEPYLAWLEHLAEEGAVVVYPTYAGLDAKLGRSRYDTMWAGLEAGLRAVAEKPGARPDAARIGVLGHSFGGGAAPAIAARAWARGWGKDGLFIGCFAPWYDLDAEAWKHLPSHACLLVATYEDDAVCDPSIGAQFLDLAPTVPAERKALRVFRSDDHGRPSLVADHLTPLTRFGTDALDTRGSWRVVDALRAYSFDGSADGRVVALGDVPDALGLGAWSDGTPVRCALSTWKASDARERAWPLGGPKESFMRRLLLPEGFSTLPLPAKDVVIPARLPESERFLAAPPEPGNDGWPAPVAAALKSGPVLVVRAGEPAIAGADRLAPAGVALVTLDKDAGALCETLSSSSGPTALLLGRDGRALLWKPSSDPNLVDAAIGLLAAVPPAK